MDTVVYESFGNIMLGLIEGALKEHQIPFMVTGAADVGLGHSPMISIRVPNEYAQQARKIIESLIS